MTATPQRAPATPHAGGGRLDRLGLALVLIVAALLAGIWTFYARERRAAIDAEIAAATEEVENIARAIEDSTLARIQAIDSVLKAVRDAFRSGGPAAASHAIRAIDFPRDAITLYVATDGTGQAIFADPPFDGAMPFLGDRPHINVHFARKRDELFIGVPVFGRIARRWISAFTRPVLEPDGSVGAIIAVTIDPFILSTSYDSFKLGPASSIELIGLDGAVRSRSVLTEEILSTSIAASTNALSASSAGHDVAMQTSSFDGIRRLTAIRKVKDLPLVVAVGIAEAHIRGRASAQHATMTLMAAIGSGLVLLLAVAIWLERRSAAARRNLKGQSIDLDNANRQLREQVAERTASEKKLRDATELLRAVVEASPVPIFCIARDRVVTIWNRAAERTLGWTAHEMLGKPIFRMRADPNDDSPPLGERAMAGEEIRNLEIVRRHKDGHPVIINAAAGPVRDQGGEILGVVFVWEDITLRRRMERQLGQAQKMEAVGQLSGGVAHDFNNLLGVIVGNLDMASDEPGMSETTRTMIAAALDASLRGSDLIQRLLAFSRRQMLQPSLIDVKAVVADLMPLLERTLGEEIQIANLADGGETIVNADRAQLESALVNLAVNARDAMPRGGKLAFAVDLVVIDSDAVRSMPELKSGRHATIRVSDTGEGIAPDVLPRVFEPFFSTKETGKGSGLGLSMVYGFISQSGGTVRIQSELGRGTVVTLYLPIDEPAADSLRAPATPAAAELPRGTERILIVEDNVDMRRVGVGILASLGYAVAEVGTPAEALSLIEGGERFDLVFTDVVMPGGLNGFDLLREIQKRAPEIRTLVASGNAGTKIQFGPNSVVMAKPYRKTELAHQVRAVLDGARADLTRAVACDD